MTEPKLRRTAVAMAVLGAIALSGVPGVSSAAGPAESNKGGAVRGTTRADDRAGVHGDQGRDRAEANKAEANKTKAKKGTAANGAASSGSK